MKTLKGVVGEQMNVIVKWDELYIINVRHHIPGCCINTICPYNPLQP